MATQSNILTVYKSRRTLIDILGSLGFNTNLYKNFTASEVDTMLKTEQLDMSLEYDNAYPEPTVYTDSKVYVKYMLSAKPVQFNKIKEVVYDMFESESKILSKKDTLIIILNDEPNDTMITKLTYLFDKEGIFVVIHNIKRLQVNILNHSMVAPHFILTPNDQEAFLRKMGIQSNEYMRKLPEISRFDPVALCICMRPGQICRIERPSITSMTTDYFRVCV